MTNLTIKSIHQLDPLGTAEDQLTIYESPLEINTQTLLLLDIARSLRELLLYERGRSF